MSESTVSRVLNGRAGVASATREAVLTAVDVLGYDRPSRLQSHAVSLVGLIIPELVNPIFPTFAQSIESALARRGFTPVLCTQTDDGLHEDDYVEMLTERGVAGIIYISGRHADTSTDLARYHRLIERGLPIVFVNGWRDEVAAPFISDDDVAAMDLAVNHLVELGHRRIGLAVGSDRYVPVIRKMAGFRAAMERYTGRVEVDDLIVNTVYSVEGGASAANALIERGATAIVSGSDLMALGAIRQARAMGRSVPEDLSVVGYDDSALIAFTDPPLTTVRQRVTDMSEAAVRALLDEVAGNPVPHAELIFTPELVVRRSTARAPDRSGRG